jgi:hypothetical protein
MMCLGSETPQGTAKLELPSWKKTSAAMAQQTISLLRDPDRLCRYGRNALEFSRQFSWDTLFNLGDISRKFVLNITSEHPKI